MRPLGAPLEAPEGITDLLGVIPLGHYTKHWETLSGQVLEIHGDQVLHCTLYTGYIHIRAHILHMLYMPILTSHITYNLRASPLQAPHILRVSHP